jgi:hypothetical protein
VPLCILGNTTRQVPPQILVNVISKDHIHFPVYIRQREALGVLPFSGVLVVSSFPDNMGLLSGV